METIYDAEPIMFLYPPKTSLAIGDDTLSQTTAEEPLKLEQVEEETEETTDEVRYTIDDIYAQMLSIRSKIATEIQVEENIEARIQRTETYLSISTGVLCFIVGAIVGYLIVGRIK